MAVVATAKSIDICSYSLWVAKADNSVLCNILVVFEVYNLIFLIHLLGILVVLIIYRSLSVSFRAYSGSPLCSKVRRSKWLSD